MGICAYLQPMHETTPAGAEVDIDKSWFELAEGLSALGLDGELIVSGNMFVADSDSDSDPDGTGFFEGRLDPDEVRRHRQQLRQVTFERYFAAYRRTQSGAADTDPGTEPYLRIHFATLVAVYAAAAEAGAGLRISAC